VKTLKIQWQIGNQCNFRCGYCHPDYHDGSNPMLDHELLNKVFNNLVASTPNHDLIYLEMLGGEPTISPAVREIITDCSDSRFKFNLTTNGYPQLDWWERAVPNLDNVILAWHSKSDPIHFKNVAEFLKDRVALTILVNAQESFDEWQTATRVYTWFKENGYTTIFKILFANHNKGNDKFLKYTADQVVFYAKENKIRIPNDPADYDMEAFEAGLYTDYKSHLCWAGVDQVVIDYFGYVYRGWCKVGNGYGNLFEKPISLDSTPRVCTRVLCKNGFDQQAKKSSKGWGM
jgi:hypothetical protein